MCICVCNSYLFIDKLKYPVKRQDDQTWLALFSFYFKFIYLFLRERERENASGGRAGRERGRGGDGRQAPRGKVIMQSLMRGSNPRSREIMT